MKKILAFIFILNFGTAKAQSLSNTNQSLVVVTADSLYATANYTKAINVYAKVGTQKAQLQIARAYNAIGNFKKAVVQYENVVKENPEWQIASFELGKLLIKTKAFDEARKLFSGLTTVTNDNPEYYYFLGEAFKELDQIASSLVSYKKAVAIDSTHLKSLFQLGKHFVITKEKANAVMYLNMGLQFYPNDVAFINLKALALYNNDEHENALPLFERLLVLNEKKEHIYTKLAYCYYKTWAFEKAKKMYHLLIKKDEDNHEAYFNIGQVFYKNRQLDSATFYVKKSIAVQKVTFEKEYSNLAHMYREKDELKTALKYYRLAIAENPNNHINYYQLCALIDQTSTKLPEKLKCYESLLEKVGTKKPFVSEMAAKRISELKQEIHMAKD